MKFIYKIFARPLLIDFPLFLLIVILTTFPKAICELMYDYEIKVVVWDFLHTYIICYLLLFFIHLLKGKFLRVARNFVLALAFIDFAIEIACIKVLGTYFYEDMVAIVCGTNLNEVKEFISTYFSLNIIFIIIVTLISSFFFLKVFGKWLQKYSRNFVPVFLSTAIISFSILTYKKSESWSCAYIAKYITLLKYELPPDLRSQPKPKVVLNGDIPDFIVMVLGESFTKFHSSLYGYEKMTNPLLDKLKMDSLLLMCDGVQAPATTTIECFKSIMSTYQQNYRDSVNWYECAALPNIMSSIGYNTIWISNQSSSGIYDNIATRYSELCDSTIFVGNKLLGMSKLDYDEEVIFPLCNFNFNKDEKYFIVVHLIGSHYEFSKRYPVSRSYFKVDNYNDKEEKQRKNLSDYDNSVLYNDSVVYEIFNLFEEKEVLGLYFPDHGIDLYESSTSYFGHAIKTNSQSVHISRQIPFMMYCSSELKLKYPSIIDKAQLIYSDNFCTENIINSFLDILNISILE